MHASPIAGDMGEYKALYRIFFAFFGLECVLKLRNVSINAIIVILRAVGDGVVKI